MTRTEVSLNRPHARSYRPDLPLRRFTEGELLKPTKADRAYYATHPLMLQPLPPSVPCFACGVETRRKGPDARCRDCQDAAKHIAKARASFDLFGIVDNTGTSAAAAA